MLEGAVEHVVARRVAPLEPAVLVGVEADVERAVAAPGVGGERHAGHGMPLAIDDLAAQRVRRPEAEFQRRPILGMDLAKVGAKCSRPDRDDRRAGRAVLQQELATGVGLRLAPAIERVAAAHGRPGDRLSLGVEHAAPDRETALEDGHRIGLPQGRAAALEEPGRLDLETHAAQIGGCVVEPPSALGVGRGLDEVEADEYDFSVSAGGASTVILAPATGAPASSFTTPPIGIPGTQRISLTAGRWSG